MSPTTAGIIGLVAVFVLIFLRMPIALVFTVVGFFGVWGVRNLDAALGGIATIPYQTATSYVMTVIPLFVLMGYLAEPTGIAEEFYDGVRRWVGQFRGGLAAAVIIGNTGFGACTGSPTGAAVTFTAISLPEMRKYKYADSLSLGCIAAGCNLALLIPPSNGFIVYGAITQTSIGQLFIAGIFPGLLLALLFLVVIYIECQHNPALGPPGPRTTWKEKMRSPTGMWALIIVFLVVIGGIYLGLFTPTEAGGAGTAVVIILGVARRKLSWQGFKTACLNTGLTWGMVAFLLIGVMVFNLFLVVTEVPFAVATYVGGLSDSPLVILLLIVLLFFILGMFLDVLAMILLMVPIFFPLITSLGIDPVQFGVLMIMMMVAGGVSPPYGMIIFAMAGMVKDVPISTIFRGALPFLAAMVVCTLLIVFFPQIATWLPTTMMKVV